MTPTKQLQIIIIANDSDNIPIGHSHTITSICPAPFVTAGKIIKEINRILESEGCEVEHSGLVEDWLGTQD